MTRPVWLGEDRGGWDHVRAHVQLLDDPRIGDTELTVYLGIARHANRFSGEARVSQQTLASYAGRSDKPVKAAISRLSKFDYIETIVAKSQIVGFILKVPPALPTPCQQTLLMNVAQPTKFGDSPVKFGDSPNEQDQRTSSPLTPQQVGGRSKGLRANGTNPRSLAKRREAKTIEDKLAACEQCNASWTCTRCAHLQVRLREVLAS